MRSGNAARAAPCLCFTKFSFTPLVMVCLIVRAVSPPLVFVVFLWFSCCNLYAAEDTERQLASEDTARADRSPSWWSYFHIARRALRQPGKTYMGQIYARRARRLSVSACVNIYCCMRYVLSLLFELWLIGCQTYTASAHQRNDLIRKPSTPCFVVTRCPSPPPPIRAPPVFVRPRKQPDDI